MTLRRTTMTHGTSSHPASPPDRQERQPCRKCGYDMRGQLPGRPCPECGTPARERTFVELPISDMPAGVIRRFRTACWLAAVAAVLITLLVLSRPWTERINGLFEWILLGLVPVWIVAVWWLTPGLELPPAAARGFSAGGRLRLLVRGLQLFWLAEAGLLLVLAIAPGLTADVRAALQLVERGTLVGCLVAVVALAVLLERLAEWTRDDSAERLFSWVAWGLPLAFLLTIVNVPLVGVVGVIARLVVIPVIMLGLLPTALVSLARSLSYAVVHSLDMTDRELRRRDREKRYHQRVAEHARRAKDGS